MHGLIIQLSQNEKKKKNIKNLQTAVCDQILVAGTLKLSFHMRVTLSQTIANSLWWLDSKQFAQMETPFTFIHDQSQMIANDRKEDTRDRKISIFMSCLQWLTTLKWGNNNMEIQS